MAKNLADISPEKLRLLARKLNAQKPGSGASQSIRRDDPRASTYPLSLGQERLWVIQQIAPEGASYNSPFAARIHMPFQARAWQHALSELARRHEVLRTTFVMIDGEPKQVIAPFRPVRIEPVDLRGLSSEQRESAAFELIHKEFEKPFDLAAGPLWRFGIVLLKDDDLIVFSSLHHGLCDGLSRQILMRDMYAQMLPLLSGKPAPLLPDLPVQYGDYAKWERERLKEQAVQDDLAYWKKQLHGASGLQLNADYRKQAGAAAVAKSEPLLIEQSVVDALKELSTREHATAFMTFLTAFHVLLFGLTGKHDVSVGTPVSTRTRPELEGLIGYFVNVLVMRGDLSGNPTFRKLLRRIRQVCVDAFSHQAAPFEKIVQELDVKRNTAQNPLFQIGFQLEETAALGGDAGTQAAGSSVEYLNFEHFAMTTSNLDLDMHLFGQWYNRFSSQMDGIRGVLTYDAGLFAPATARQLVLQYQSLLRAIAADPDRHLSELASLASGGSIRMAAPHAAATAKTPKSLAALFSEQVKKTPNAIALKCAGLRLTYRDLDNRADRLARCLQQQGAGPEVMIGICLDRSIDLVVAVIAVLKTGAAYVPLDPAYPAHRIAFIASDSGMRMAVAGQQTANLLPDCVTAISPEQNGTSELVSVSIDPANAAYVIYTSGSTGTPKGVVVSHEQVTRLFTSTNNEFNFGPADVWTLFHSFAFDFSVWELWGALLYGGKLVIVPYEVSRSPEEFYRLLERENVTVLNQTPSAFAALMSEDAAVCAPLDNLRLVVFGGEALDFGMLRGWFARHPEGRPRLVNMYGITETTVHVTQREITEGDAALRAGSPVGLPISDLTVYVLGPEGNLVPIGSPGEIYVSGPGVARGYLNRPDLTADRFQPNPFSSSPGDRLYRTGDLARWTASGELEHLGRVDLQVKVSGHRIELQEIESALRSHKGVKTVAVSLEEIGSGDKRLVAYCVPARDRTGQDSDRFELPNGIPIHHNTRGETLFLYEEIFEKQTYFRHGISLSGEACVLDVGANIGMFTLFARLHCPACRILAFEPIQPIYEKLRKNASELPGQIQVFPFGLSDSERVADFRFYPANSVMSGIAAYAQPEMDASVSRQYLKNRAVEGDAARQLLEGALSSELQPGFLRRLSDVIREESIERIDLLKIDVERSELDVLAGIDENDWPKVRAVVAEVSDSGNQDRSQRVERMLSERGFQVVVETDESLRGTGLHTVYARRAATDATNANAASHTFEESVQSVATPNSERLRKYAGTLLPQYMVPSEFVFLDGIPLTANGKVDRESLAAIRQRAIDGADKRSGIVPRDSVELRIAHIWEELLGKESIGVRDDFFALGGNSILVVRLHSRLAATLGRTPPMQQFFQRPTIEALAQSLKRQPDLVEASPLVPLKKGLEGGPSLFLVHAAGGQSAVYYKLARLLGPRWSVYGLEDTDRASGTQPRQTFEEMGERYVRAIQSAQATGPYVLGGWSSGAALSLEMARQLETVGQSTRLLAFFDALPPYRPALILEDYAAASARVLATITRNIAIYTGREFSADEVALSRLNPEQQMQLFVQGARNCDILPPDMTAEDLQSFLDMSLRHVQSLWRYQPEMANSRIVLFRAAERLPTFIAEESVLETSENNGWEKLSALPVVVEHVKGNHVTMFREPNVEVLAATLSKYLDGPESA